MLVSKIMQVLKNLFGLNKKIAASEIAIKDINDKPVTLDAFLKTFETYSTEEQCIGTWIDDKPLYQKVFKFTDVITNNSSFTHNISDVETIWVEKAFVQKVSSNRLSYTLPITYYGTGTGKDELSIYVDETNFVYKVQTSWDENWTKYVVLNYTKTTD